MRRSEPQTRNAACLLLTLLLPAAALGTRSVYTGIRSGTFNAMIGPAPAIDAAAERPSTFATHLVRATHRAGRALLPGGQPSQSGQGSRAANDAVMLLMLITQHARPIIALSR